VASEQDRAQVVQLVLGGLASGATLAEIERQLRSFEDRAFPFPADVLTELGADALAVAGATRTSPISLEDLAARYLPEYEIRGNTEHQKSRAAVQLIVDTHAGIVPDFDGVAGWWRAQDLWWFSFTALVMMLRLAARSSDTPIAAVCAEIAAKQAERD
jgi:hypothetical protein